MTARIRLALVAFALAACTGSGGGGDDRVSPTTNAGFTGIAVHCRYDACASDAQCTDCTGSGATLACVGGMCTTACDKGASCASGEVCSASPGAEATAFCLPDCSNAQACPSGLDCQPLFYAGRRGCLPAETGPSACNAVDATSCSSAPPFYCGKAYSTVPCGDGTCPVNSSCVPCTNSSGMCCHCADGYAPTCCSGDSCSGTDCHTYCGGDYSWGCSSGGQAWYPPGCTDSLAEARGSCACTDGRTIPFSCGGSATCEALCAAQPGGYGGYGGYGGSAGFAGFGGGGAAGSGAFGGSGGGPGAWEDTFGCASSGCAIAERDAWLACATAKCAPQFTACFGGEYSLAYFSGSCGGWATCSYGCACDAGCRTSCTNAIAGGPCAIECFGPSTPLVNCTSLNCGTPPPGCLF